MCSLLTTACKETRGGSQAGVGMMRPKASPQHLRAIKSWESEPLSWQWKGVGCTKQVALLCLAMGLGLREVSKIPPENRMERPRGFRPDGALRSEMVAYRAAWGANLV